MGTGLLRRPALCIAIGAFLVAQLAIFGARASGPVMAAHLSAEATRAIEQVGAQPVTARFTSPRGWPSRHPVLSGGRGLPEHVRDRAAKAVAAIPGVGGVRWADGKFLAGGAAAMILSPTHCEDDVAALLRARTIRFEESSARISDSSSTLVAEVAAALRPCLGSIIAITGHTDASGPEPGNLELSLARAEAVRQALIGRGIPYDGLRVRGMGSRTPVEGLDPTDAANRRIEFAVLATRPVTPTPVDTAGPR